MKLGGWTALLDCHLRLSASLRAQNHPTEADGQLGHAGRVTRHISNLFPGELASATSHLRRTAQKLRAAKHHVEAQTALEHAQALEKLWLESQAAK